MKAKCIYFGKCSGCTLQQFPYVKQLHDKSRRIRSELTALLPKDLKPEQAILAIAPSPLEQGYRTSGKLCLHEDEIGRRSIGLYERGSKKVVDIPQCSVHHPEINRLVERLFGFGKKLPEDVKLYQHNKKQFQAGRLKFVVIRYCPDTRDFGLVISHTGVDRERLRSWFDAKNLPNISVYESLISEADEDLVVARKVEHLTGPKTFRFRLGPHDFHIDPIAFFQANFSLVESFIETITAWHQGESLLDIYGGFGSYSFKAAGRFKKISIIEANPHSIRSADDLKSREGFPHIHPIAMTAEDFLKKLLKNNQETAAVSDVIINPPRTGISRSVIAALRSPAFTKLERLTYVSCDLGTLKRDLRELIQGGLFEVETVLPFDMFPQTEHVETVVRLRRRMQVQTTLGQKPFKPHAPSARRGSKRPLG